MADIDIDALAREARADLEAATTVADLDAAKIRHLGKNGPIVLLLRDIKDLPPEQRGPVGKGGNIARKQLEALATQRHEQLAAAELDARLIEDAIDVSLPPRAMPQGTLHLLTQTRRLLEDIFLGMGYSVIDAPEVESEWYGFTALNTPVGHPARNPSDTFYIAVATRARVPTTMRSSCARRRRPRSCARCSSRSRRCTSCTPGACTAATTSTPRTRTCSTRWKRSRSTRGSRLRT